MRSLKAFWRWLWGKYPVLGYRHDLPETCKGYRMYFDPSINDSTYIEELRARCPAENRELFEEQVKILKRGVALAQSTIDCYDASVRTRRTGGY